LNRYLNSSITPTVTIPITETNTFISKVEQQPIHKLKLEIWGKANVSPSGTLSATGGKIEGAEIPPVAKLRSPKPNALAHAKRTLST